MSDIPINPGVPGDPILPVGGEGIAERYVEKELVESRASLRRTQIIGVVLSLFVLGYMGYLTSNFRASLEPKGAAQIATGLASQRFDDIEPQVSTYIHDEVPKMIRQAPDEVIKRLPEYRKNLEDRVVAEVDKQAQAGSATLDKNLDDFLTAHKDQVGQLLKDGQDPTAVASLGQEMEDQFRTYLNDQKIGDTTLQEKLDTTLSALKQVSARTAKLASNQGLTSQEKTVRHAVGMLMQRIKSAQAAEPNAIPHLDAEKLNEGAENLKNQAMGTLDKARSTVQDNMPEGLKSKPAGEEDAASNSAKPAPAAPTPKSTATPKKP